MLALLMPDGNNPPATPVTIHNTRALCTNLESSSRVSRSSTHAISFTVIPYTRLASPATWMPDSTSPFPLPSYQSAARGHKLPPTHRTDARFDRIESYGPNSTDSAAVRHEGLSLPKPYINARTLEADNLELRVTDI
jgi:hypothetical protein